MDILLVICRVTRIRIADYFCVNFNLIVEFQEKSSALMVKIGLEVGGFPLICQMFVTFVLS